MSGTTIVALDLRLFYELRPIPRVTIGPLFELSPTGLFSGNEVLFELVVRPGVRIGYAPVPRMLVYVEPITFDFAVLTTDGSTVSTTVTAQYTPSVGAQYRF